MISSTSLVAAIVLLSSVNAIPFTSSLTALPRDVSHVGLDEARSEYVAYKRDGSLYGRFAVATGDSQLTKRASSCGDLSVDDAKKIPGWSAIEQYAKDNWGNGSKKIVTNPEDYLDRPAQFCVSDQKVELSFTEDPICQSRTTTTKGQLVGTDGEVSIEVDQGFNTGSSYTVSQAASIGVSSTLSVSVGIPDVADVSASVTVSTEITNTLSSTVDVSYNDVNKVTVKMTAHEGKTCVANAEVTSCNTQATGNIQYIATGWVWFNYDSRTEGHYKWAANMDSILNEDDRSSWAEMEGSMSSDTYAAYSGSCS